MRVDGSILVTGVPRSGTTWLARLLACAPHTAMIGREPMNPRHRQYALGGTLDGWTRLRRPTPKQVFALRTAYLGLNPLVYGRYGRHQYSASLPSTRVVVKDPFALLSLSVITSVTHTKPVLVYRHPGAVLASYRRMGWTADLSELLALLGHQASEPAGGAPGSTLSDLSEDGAAMCAFWCTLHRLALEDMDRIPGALVVSHEDVSAGGVPAARQLFDLCGLPWTPATERRVAAMYDVHPRSKVSTHALHNFGRSPGEVTCGWRAELSAQEATAAERAAADVLSDLERRRATLR